MSEKLSPPLLEGIIPAFYSDGGGIVITIPFSMNRMVGPDSVYGFAVKIKTVHNSKELFTQNITPIDNNDNTINSFLSNKELVIRIGEELKDKFKVGQFYKIQVAYISKDNSGEIIGYYSNIGVAKYTCKPSVSIRGLSSYTLNSHLYFYEGEYRNDDPNEGLYSYCFTIYDEKDNIISSSGDLIYNTALESELVGYAFPQEISSEYIYQIEYKVTTVNGLRASSGRYDIIQRPSVNADLDVDLCANLNYENGYVDLKLQAKSMNAPEQIYAGSFVMTRASEDSEYSVWQEIKRFKLNTRATSLDLWRDFTIEQGKSYIYAIQQYNDQGLYSNKIKSNIITADFEDAFLYDGKRQLKIKYNPKVSSFKKVVLETKVDTIGSKYPFVFKNDSVYYSEFPISGLISYFMDEDNLFFNKEEFASVEKTTDLSNSNIALEREFKLLVLEWLTDGKPKLFRSPTEGNYIVRLMNVSLAPNDTLGRMLHTFSCTAYEVDDSNNIQNFIDQTEIEDLSFQSETILFAQGAGVGVTLNHYPAKTAHFQDMSPGSVIKIRFKGNNAFTPIVIGATGSFNIDIGTDITDIQLVEQQTQGQVTYTYQLRQPDLFSDIRFLNFNTRVESFVGECDILEKIQYVTNANGEKVKNPKINLIKIYSIQSEKRPITSSEQAPSIYIYQGADQTYRDDYNNLTYESYSPIIYINGQSISVNETNKLLLNNPGKIDSIINGNGVLTTVVYEVCTIDYNIEYKNGGSKDNPYLQDLFDKQAAYNTALDKFYRKKMYNEGNNTLHTLRKIVQMTYIDYIFALVLAQEKEKELKGVIE